MTERAPRLEVIRAEDQHADVLATFIQAVWDPSATTASVIASRAKGAAANVAEPGVAPPTWIALQAGRVLGYVTTIPIRLWDGQQDWAGYWIKGLMVLPEFRSGPIGYLVLKAAAQTLPLSGGLAVAPAARKLFTALGYTDCGVIPNWIRPLRPGRMFQRLDLEQLGLSRLPKGAPTVLRLGRASGLGALGGWIGGGALRLYAGIRRTGSGGYRTGPFDPSRGQTEIDELWCQITASFPSAVVRDAAYLVPRYPAADSANYRWIEARQNGQLRGIAVLRIPRENGDERLRGIRVATLADLLFPPGQPEVGRALLGGVERAARALEADAVLASSPARVVTAELRGQCYLPLGGTVHLLWRQTGSESQLATTVSDWWLQRGDGGADDAL